MMAGTPGAFGSLVIFRSSGDSGGKPCARHGSGLSAAIATSTMRNPLQQKDNLDRLGMRPLAAHFYFLVEPQRPGGKAEAARDKPRRGTGASPSRQRYGGESTVGLCRCQDNAR